MCVKFQLSNSNSLKDMRGSQIYTQERYTLTTPLAENFYAGKEYLTRLNVCKISTF